MIYFYSLISMVPYLKLYWYQDGIKINIFPWIFTNKIAGKQDIKFPDEVFHIVYAGYLILFIACTAISIYRYMDIWIYGYMSKCNG